MKIAEKIRKTRFFSIPRGNKNKAGKRGVALITVLTIMSLTTILVLTFFSLANSERTASNTYSHGLQAQQVAEQAVNMAIGQIRKATTVDVDTSTNAWASQPGAIRVWDDSGNLLSLFKLYSDETMVEGDVLGATTDFDDMLGWSSQPEQYVDLNEPVIRGKKVYYPIVNPAAAETPAWPKAIGDDDRGVEGFRYNYDNLHTLSDEGRIGQKAAGILEDEEKLTLIGGHPAMPAKWIYQTADGSLGTVIAGSGKFKPFTGATPASEENPIVARFAFWSDDETSKLNVNVHAGGLAWDIPKAGGDMDMDMAKYQPAQHEWQRYPGHPASTHLIPALAPGVLDIVNDRDAMEMLFRIVPRVVGGGSESGTRLIDTRNEEEANGLIADKDNLFPTIDDIIMRPDRTVAEFPDAKGKALPEEELSEYLERAKFFITAVSRAPEVNLHNKPRVAIWPINEAEYGSEDYDLKLTAFDRLIHYCASMGEDSSEFGRYEYIFKRGQADSDIYDYESIPRNKELYEYLYKFLDKKVPGYGGSFTGKYSEADTKQLLTLIFDYIRSTNLHDDTVYGKQFEQAFKKVNSSKHRTFTNWRDGNDFNKGFGQKGHGQVTPIRIDGTKGIGRFFTLSSSEIMISCVAEVTRGHPQYPGVNGYRGNGQQDPGDIKQYTNLPPLAPAVRQETPSSWPPWLTALKTAANGGDAEAEEEFEAAFKEWNWNWNLAFLSDSYKAAVLANPTSAKFNRGLLAGTGDELRLKDGEKMAQAVFLFNLFSPSIGWSGINPDMEVHIEKKNGMTFSGETGGIEFLGFSGQGNLQRNGGGDASTYIWATNWIKPHREGGVRAWGGLMPFPFTFQARDVLGDRAYRRQAGSVWRQMWDKQDSTSPHVRCKLTPLDRGYDKLEDALGAVSNARDIGNNGVENTSQSYRYDLVTVPFKVTGGSGVSFSGGDVEFRIYDGGEYTENSYQDDGSGADANTLVQTIELEYPSFSHGTNELIMATGRPGYVNEFNALSSDSSGVLEMASLTADPANPWDTEWTSAQLKGGRWSNSVGPADNAIYSGNTRYLNLRGRMADATIHWSGPYVHNGDIVKSVAVAHGDMRIIAARPEIDKNDDYFQPHRNYGKNQKMAHSLTNALGRSVTGFNADDSKDYLIVTGLPGNRPYRGAAPLPFATEKSEDVQLYGDFDNGAGTMIDGPYINKPDEGNVHALKTKFEQELVHHWEALRNYGDFPYFSNPEKAESGGPAYFSPNRIVSGPGMFGSLPTQADDNRPWQTLLFRPNVIGAGYSSHPGAETPPDHLIMDLFWMPVVEPYAISEPLSTAGRINMNYDILPYRHIDRSTAIRGVFRSELILCIPNKWHESYKHNRGRGRGYHWRDAPYNGQLQGKRLRGVIVEDATLEQFRSKFDQGEIFKSATEICDIHLITEEIAVRLGINSNKAKIGTYEPTLEDMENGKYWRDHSLVGDNSRERPYTNIHQRLTTKSNTFRVHYRAQVLKQSRRDNSTDYENWNPALDTVQAEYRGSSIVERYIDPDDPEVPDFADANSISIDEFYKFRVVNPRRFAP